MSAGDPLRIAAFISGGGRTLVNLAECIDGGTLPASIELVVASREQIAGVERARARGLDVRIGSKKAVGGDEAAVHDAIDEWLDAAGVELVCLCGYLRHVRIAPAWEGRIVNIHPALLPDFGGQGMYGDHVHRAVLESGRRFSGCTVHVVNGQYDEGPIILQRACPVRPDDDVDALAARVFAEECLAYPEAIRLIAEGRIRIEETRVRLSPSSRAGSPGPGR